jgi:hypothetical protein
MYHHDKRAYGVALKDAEAHLQQQIALKSASAVNVITRVRDTVLVDRVVPTKKVQFSFRTDVVKAKTKTETDGDRKVHRVIMGTKGRGESAFSAPLHKHALEQAASRVDIPVTFVNRFLGEEYGGELITDALNTVYKHRGEEKFLVRSSDEEIRGVLSDTYRRMDSGPILDAFARTCNDIGAVPIEGIGGELRFSVKALIPKTYVIGKQQGNEEIFAFGVSLSNSDFGCGALSLQFFLWRIWCSNTATREDSLRKVHLGKRLAENIEYAQETYAADTNAMALMVRDHVRGILSPPKIDEAVATLEVAMETSVDPKKFFDKDGELAKLKLTRAEIDATRETFNNGDVTVLPRGTSVARMSQAVAWMAQSATPERRLELERVAGAIMEPKTTKPEPAAAA